MSTTYQINEGAGAHAFLRGATRDLSGWTIRLSAEAGGESVVLSEVQGVAPGEGEVADYRLPIPALPPDFAGYELVVVAEREGERDIVLMPSADDTIKLVVTDRGYAGDDEDAWPTEPAVGTVATRAADGGEGTFHVDDASGEHAGPLLTYEIAPALPGPPAQVTNVEDRADGSRAVEFNGETEVTLPPGKDGVGIADILQDGGTLEVVLTDDEKKTFDLSPLVTSAVEAVATQVADARDAAQAAKVQTVQLFASTSGEDITDEWLLAKLPATQITGAPTGNDYPILWPEGAAGVYRVERDGAGAVQADEHTHEPSGATVRRPVLRGEDGNAVAYDTPQITRS